MLSTSGVESVITGLDPAACVSWVPGVSSTLVAVVLLMMSGGGTVSAVTQVAIRAIRVKAQENPDFKEVLESRKKDSIIEHLDNSEDERQKRRDFQVSGGESGLTSFASGHRCPPHLR